MENARHNSGEYEMPTGPNIKPGITILQRILKEGSRCA
jgi:hypothetical protein